MSSKTHPGVGFPHPHAQAAKNIAGQIDHTHVRADLGKKPLPKRAFAGPAPEIHSGMMAKAKDGTHFAGLSGQDLGRYDANGPDPLSGAPRGKVLTPVAPSFGQRSRVDDALASAEPGAAHDRAMLNKNAFTKGMQKMSEVVLDEAISVSGPDHPTNMARAFGKLPDAVEED